MAAIDTTQYSALVQRTVHELVARKNRKNWAYRNPGVTLVFAIVGVLALLLIGLFVQKKLAARKAARSNV